MNFKKYILFGVAAMGMGLTSCIGDLDLKPNDPNLVNPSDPKCCRYCYQLVVAV